MGGRYHSCDDAHSGVEPVLKSSRFDGFDTWVVLVKLDKHDNNEDNESGLFFRSDNGSHEFCGRE